MEDKYIGWQCPKCGQCYSPRIDVCKSCSQSMEEFIKKVMEEQKDDNLLNRIVFSDEVINAVCGTGVLNTHINSTPPDSTTMCTCSGYISNSPNGICSKCGMPEWKHYNVSYT